MIGRTISRNDDPPDDGSDAYEFQIGGHWFAFDDSDNLFVYRRGSLDRGETNRDDEYVLIATLDSSAWTDAEDPIHEAWRVAREWIANNPGQK